MAPFLPAIIPALPAIGKGLLWTVGAASTVPMADAVMNMPKEARKSAVAEGPDSFGDYNIPFYMRPFIDEGSLDDSRDKYVMDQAKKDPRVQAAQSLNSSLQLKSGQNAQDFLAANSAQIRKDARNEKISDSEAISAAAYNSPQAVRQRDRENDARQDQLNEARWSREDSNNRFLWQERNADKRRAHERGEGKLDRRHREELQENSNNLQMQISLMNNELEEKRMDYDRETRRLDKRSEAIAQLMSGIGQLGGAFAV